MATTFLEPGGDATFNVALITNGGFWAALSGTSVPTIATDFVHQNHIKSIAYTVNNTSRVITPSGIVSDGGARISAYIYIKTLPNSLGNILGILQSGAQAVVT